MKTITTLLVTFVLGGLLLIATPRLAAAACANDEIETSFAWGGKTCFKKENKSADTSNPLFAALLTVFNFLAVGVGVAVTGGIIYGAILYISSNGNAATAQKGVTVIVNSVIGLFLFIFMYAILNYLVPGGLFK